MKFVIPGRDSHVSAVSVRNSGYCTLEKVVVRNSPGAAIAYGLSTACNFLACRIEPAPGAFLSTNADGLHACNNVGIGPYMEGCRFSHMGDDGVNVYYRGQYLHSAEGGRLVALGLPHTGTLSIVPPETGVIKAETTIASTA